MNLLLFNIFIKLSISRIEGEIMNTQPILLVELKVGELYLLKTKYIKHNTLQIAKIESIELARKNKTIVCSLLETDDYHIFSAVLEAEVGIVISGNFLKNRIEKNSIEYFFYIFDEEWFFKNRSSIQNIF